MFGVIFRKRVGHGGGPGRANLEKLPAKSYLISKEITDPLRFCQSLECQNYVTDIHGRRVNFN